MNNNYKWNTLKQGGQNQTGHLEVYETNIKSLKVIVNINFLPIITGQTDKKVMITVLLEGDKSNWTKGTISSIFEDCENRVKIAGNNYYPNNSNTLDYFSYQLIYLEKISYNNSDNGTFSI